MKLFLIVLAAVLTAGCAVNAQYSPEAVSARTAYLDDCTESISKHLEWRVPVVPKRRRHMLVAAASAWAEDNCYAPCDYKMCATIRSYTDDTATVFISYDLAEEVVSQNPEEIIVRIGPEAEVQFDLKTFRVIDYAYWHTGCRSAAENCALRNH